MQEVFCYYIGILVAVGVTLMIAFPDFLTPPVEKKKKRFTGRHWGGYHDSKSIEHIDKNEGVEVGRPAKPLRYTAGGTTYARGK